MLENLKILVVRIATLLKGKVDKESGKSLVSDTLITKLEGLEKVTSSEYLADNKLKLTLSDNSTVITSNTLNLNGYVQKETGKGLIDLALANTISQKVDKVPGKGLLKSEIASNLETNWNQFVTATKKYPTAIAITGTDTKKLVLTLNDSTTLESQWVDLKGSDVDFSGAGFDKTTGVFKINNSTQFSIDGRYRLLSAKIPWADIEGAPAGLTLPSWVGATKPTYSWSEITNKPYLDFLPLTGGTINPGNVTDFREGIRINKAADNWSVLTLGTTGDHGMQSGAWALLRNPSGEFQIGPNSEANSGLRLSSDTAYWKGSRIATDEIIKSYDKYYGRSANHLGALTSVFSGVSDYYKPHLIFTLSKDYLPTETTLGNMYGIGYTVGDNNPNSLVGSLNPEKGTSESHWGLYGTENGFPKWFLSGSGHIVAEKGFKTKDGNPNMFPTLDGGTPYLGKRQITTIDLTDLPQDRYYLTYTTGTTQDRYQTIIQSVLWNSGTPSWKTHPSGFSFFIEFEYTGGGWGTINPQLRCTKHHYMHTSVPPAIRIGHAIQSSTQYIYLRGGGKYHFHTTSIKGDKVEWKCDKVTTGLKTFEGADNLDQVSTYEDRHVIISTDMFSIWKANYQNRGYVSTGIKGFEAYEIMLSTGDNRANLFANTSNEVSFASELVPGAYTNLFAKGYKVVNEDTKERTLLSNGTTGKDPFIDRWEQYELSNTNLSSFRNLPTGMYRVAVPGEGGCMAVFRTNSSASAIFLYAPTYQSHRLRYNWSVDQNRWGSPNFKELAYLEDVNRPGADINGSWNYTTDWVNNLIYVNAPCNVALDALADFTGLSFINRHNGTTTFSGPFTFRYLGATSFQGAYGTSCTVNRRGSEIFVHINKL